MTIDWRATLSDLDGALGGASTQDRRIGAELRSRLLATGRLYDRLVPVGSSEPSVLTESAEHEQWRTTFRDALGDLDQIAAAADSGAPASIGTSTEQLRAAEAAVVARLEAALELPQSEGTLVLLRVALATPRPVEPRFYVKGYYRTTRGHRLGDLEGALVALGDAITGWLAVL